MDARSFCLISRDPYITCHLRLLKVFATSVEMLLNLKQRKCSRKCLLLVMWSIHRTSLTCLNRGVVFCCILEVLKRLPFSKLMQNRRLRSINGQSLKNFKSYMCKCKHTRFFSSNLNWEVGVAAIENIPRPNPNTEPHFCNI